MSSWTTLSSALFTVGKPITSAIGLALNENPSAIAEGATSAPPVRAGWHPYDQTAVGTNDGLVYSSAVSGTVANVESPNFADGYEYAFEFDQVSHNGAGSRDFQIEFYRATSAAYSAVKTSITIATPSDSLTGRLEVLHPRITRKAHVIREELGIDGNNGFTAAMTGSYGITHTTAQKLLKVRFSFSADSIDAGKIYMYRRRAD